MKKQRLMRRLAAVSTCLFAVVAGWMITGYSTLAHAGKPVVEPWGPMYLDFPFLDCGDYWMWHSYTLSGTTKWFYSKEGQLVQIQIRTDLDDYVAYNPANPGPVLTGHSGNASEEHYFEQVKFDNDGIPIWDKVTFKGLHLVMPGYGPSELRIFAGRVLYLPVDPANPDGPWYIEADTGVRVEGDDPTLVCGLLR